MFKKNDIILIAVILLLCLGAFLFMFLMKEEGSTVVVTIDGNVYDTFELTEDMTYTVEGPEGTWNTFEIKGGVVDMIDASCPDKICVNHKEIHYNHDTIVCLPNKVVLEIISKEKNEVDIIAN